MQHLQAELRDAQQKLLVQQAGMNAAALDAAYDARLWHPAPHVLDRYHISASSPPYTRRPDLRLGHPAPGAGHPAPQYQTNVLEQECNNRLFTLCLC